MGQTMTGTTDGTPWPVRNEASSDMQLVPVCIVAGSTITDYEYLPAGTLLCPDTDVSGDACYSVADTGRWSDGSAEQDETKLLILFEDVYGLADSDQYAKAMIRGIWSKGRNYYVGSAPTTTQAENFQRLTLSWQETP